MQRSRGKIAECIQLCWDCGMICQGALYRYFLDDSESRATANHVLILTDCITTCRTAADLMMRDSALSISFCTLCAIVCEACAKSCEDVGSDEMKRCAEICRACADACQGVALARRAA